MDLTDQVFGRLTAIEKVGKDRSNNFLWGCECECGNEKVIPTSSLNAGRSKSCGCSRKGNGGNNKLTIEL